MNSVMYEIDLRREVDNLEFITVLPSKSSAKGELEKEILDG